MYIVNIVMLKHGLPTIINSKLHVVVFLLYYRNCFHIFYNTIIRHIARGSVNNTCIGSQ